MDLAAAIVQKDSLARKCLVARKAQYWNSCRCVANGSYAQSVKPRRSQTIGDPMPQPPLPPSSPLSIEPISMRIPDACRYTGISRSTLYLLISRGEVEVIKIGAA